mmetsp:Transcript_54670/g.176808  ORF Transcript_54670/g.176808 Transcript_54670/m.176808 type:complete len:217 (+) Transcript_54670:257-907(+)
MVGSLGTSHLRSPKTLAMKASNPATRASRWNTSSAKSCATQPHIGNRAAPVASEMCTSMCERRSFWHSPAGADNSRNCRRASPMSCEAARPRKMLSTFGRNSLAVRVSSATNGRAAAGEEVPEAAEAAAAVGLRRKPSMPPRPPVREPFSIAPICSRRCFDDGVASPEVSPSLGVVERCICGWLPRDGVDGSSLVLFREVEAGCRSRSCPDGLPPP